MAITIDLHYLPSFSRFPVHFYEGHFDVWVKDCIDWRTMIFNEEMIPFYDQRQKVHWDSAYCFSSPAV